MSGNKKSLLFFVLLLIIPFVHAQDFSIFADTSVDEICPGSTGLFTDILTNDGLDALSFSVSTSGSAVSFSTSVPQGFTLFPGKTKTIYTYVSPRSTTSTGTYDLSIRASADGESETITHTVPVRDCYEYSLESINPEEHVCPDESATFDFRVQNNGLFTESYDLSVGGAFSSSVVLGVDRITLNPGETETVSAFVSSTSEDVGDNDFTLKTSPLNSNTIRTATSTLIVDACYEFNLKTERDLVNMCEHSQETIPITVENTGSTSNTFNLNIDGPLWANLEKNTITVAPNSIATINLVLNPDYGVEGSFELRFTAESQKGDISAQNNFNVNVKKCHGVSVDLEKSSDSICNSLENTYSVNIRNVGEFPKGYFLRVDGPDWVTLDKTSVSLEVGQEEKVTLTVNPPFDTTEASYIINVEATAQDSAILTSSDKIEVTTVSRDECFQALLGVDEDRVEVFYDSSATTPIVIENKGSYSTTYDLAITGTASSFVYLNPSSVKIDSGKSEIIYLYIAPSGEVVNGDYSITVSARSGDSAILASEKIDISVSESEFLSPEDQEQESSDRESFISRLIGFITGLFSVDIDKPSEQEEEVAEEQEIEEVDDEDLETTSEEETTEEVEEQQLEELLLVNTKLSEGESEEFLLGDETHIIEVTTTGDDSINITISSDPISLNLEVGGVRKLDLDEDGFYDLQVTFLGYDNEGKADIVYGKISEPVVMEEVVEEPIVEEPVDGEIISSEDVQDEQVLDEITGEVVLSEENLDNEEGSKGGFLAGIISSIVDLKFNIIGAIVIVIVIYFIFKGNFHKKIIKFFEEEIEEEKVPALGTEEKKSEKPTEKKKEEKKTTKKETKKKEETEDTEDEIDFKGLSDDKSSEEESDKEDFIIEFDDEEDNK